MTLLELKTPKSKDYVYDSKVELTKRIFMYTEALLLTITLCLVFLHIEGVL